VQPAASPPGSGPTWSKQAEETVEASVRALQLVLSRPHRPAEARVAHTAAERALAGAIRALAAAAADRPSPRVGAGRRAVGAWTDLLVERIRLAALDEPGGHVATVVRVRSHAAIGPHIAGMDLGDRDPLTGPAGGITAMGIDLVAAIDAAAAERALPGPGPTPLALPPGLAGPGAGHRLRRRRPRARKVGRSGGHAKEAAGPT
jgi:hypothetical protein